jgi:hypothetical protein
MKCVYWHNENDTHKNEVFYVYVFYFLCIFFSRYFLILFLLGSFKHTAIVQIMHMQPLDRTDCVNDIFQLIINTYNFSKAHIIAP